MRRLLFECYDRTFEGMTDSEWRVFCAICKHANDDTGGDCFPSTSLLAKESRLHKNTVPPQIKSLEEKKWIRTEQESGKKRYFFVDVGRILSCPRIGVNDSVPLQEPVPLNNSVPLQEPVADGYRKIEGTGTESCTRREQLKGQEENRNLFEGVSKNEGTPKSEDTLKNEGTPKSLGEGTPNSRDTGTPKTRDLKKEEKKEKSMYAPSVEVAHTSVSSKPAKKEPQGSRLTLEELPDEWYSECRRIQPKADPHKVFEEFRDHWISQPGAKGRKSDWTATWRNWCRRINTRDLERVGYEPGRAQFMVKPEPVNPFKVTPQNCPPRQKTEEELEAERSFDLFERVLNGEV